MNIPQRPVPTRILGIDFGMARLGLALSDESKIIASPLLTFQAEKKSEATAQKLCKEFERLEKEYKCKIEKVVFGLPLMMNGKKGPIADAVLYFVEQMKKYTDIPLITWDERLTTVQAERSLREGSLTRKRRSLMVDTVAATLILQSYLDHQKMQNYDGTTEI